MAGFAFAPTSWWPPLALADGGPHIARTAATNDFLATPMAAPSPGSVMIIRVIASSPDIEYAP
jgi:hypothetical protein